MNDNNNNNNSSQQRNDTDIDFAIIQMKEPIENIMNLQTTYQDVFNISDTLQWKGTENKCDILLGINNNTVPAWKKGNTLIVDDPILSGLIESKMSRKRLIKVRIFPGATIQDMKFFVVPHLKKNPDFFYHSRWN